MKKFSQIVIGIACAAGISLNAIAQDDPSEVLIKAAESNSTEKTEIPPQERWQAYLRSQGWENGEENGEVSYLPERNLVISSASEFTRVGIGQPGWVESRIAAFERAELEAKTKIIRFLAENPESERSLDLLEKASWSDGSVEEMKQLSEVGATLRKLGKKTLALTDVALDSALRKLDSNYDPADYETQTPEQKQTILEEKFNRKIRTMAMRTTIGITPVYTAEGKIKGEYKMLVGVVWSPKLNQVAMSMFNDEYNIPAMQKGKPLEDYLPQSDSELQGTLGSRVVVDESGHFAVLAYAQAQPRKSAPSREQSALNLAQQIAGERARAQIVNFVREGLAFRSQETTQELSREFSDATVGTETVREIQRRITASRNQVKLRGLRTMRQWEATDPATGLKVAGTIVAWSPSSNAISKNIDHAMKAKPKPAPLAPAESTAGENTDAIESIKIDTSAY